MKFSFFLISIPLLFFIFLSCAPMQNVNKSYLNHKAMNLDKGLTDEPGKAFTSVGGGAGSASAGCATCAK